ncbi:MAG: NADH-quinone oxidoreductase subunit C [Elusimicrobiales bacterium]|nr:NADH-quinone oxidoreductase subunit C [Elusimicrobiales bacterium]
MSEFAREEKVKADIEAKFAGAVTNASVQRKNRVWLELEPSRLPELLAWLKAAGFDHLATVTGFDEGENLGAHYHMTDTKMLVNVKVKTPRTNPVLPSVLKVFPGALSYELELQDMLGIKVEGLPPGRRYPLDDDFPTDQYPLRKDWKVEEYLAKNPLFPTEAK